MKRLNKPFEIHTTLIIIYFALVTVSLALYALIQIFFEDKNTASNLLSWSATLFATIALLFTFNTWRDQKASEVISNLSNECMQKIDHLLVKNDDLGGEILDKLNGNHNDFKDLYKDYKRQCYELHSLLLRINKGINNNDLNALILVFMNQTEAIKSIAGNTLHCFDILNEDDKSSFRLQITNLSASFFSNLIFIKEELSPSLLFSKSPKEA